MSIKGHLNKNLFQNTIQCEGSDHSSQQSRNARCMVRPARTDKNVSLRSM